MTPRVSPASLSVAHCRSTVSFGILLESTLRLRVHPRDWSSLACAALIRRKTVRCLAMWVGHGGGRRRDTQKSGCGQQIESLSFEHEHEHEQAAHDTPHPLTKHRSIINLSYTMKKKGEASLSNPWIPLTFRQHRSVLTSLQHCPCLQDDVLQICLSTRLHPSRTHRI